MNIYKTVLLLEFWREIQPGDLKQIKTASVTWGWFFDDSKILIFDDS